MQRIRKIVIQIQNILLHYHSIKLMLHLLLAPQEKWIHTKANVDKIQKFKEINRIKSIKINV